MSEIKKTYEEVVKNIVTNLQDKENIKFILEQIDLLAQTFSEEMDKVDKKMEKVTNRQNEIEEKVENFEKVLDNIEKDIYFDDSEFDLEIVCPYCNFSFMLDQNETRDEVECPECKNLIEIDWDGECMDDACNGHCGGCGNGCMNNDMDDDDTDEDDM